ncbi:MAG TPA: 2-oxo acid dehydrogenase subunit E2 [Tissierellia bacterium]|nr:2-oxo acid dehydrogenase subunit E2 [Tissierellia bacterium]
MATKVIMPKQGLLMTEGYITKWLVPEGGKTVKGEPLFEMETDKLTITIEAPETGTLLKIIRGEDETVPITETIAIIGEEGEDISALLNETEESEVVEEKETTVISKDETSEKLVVTRKETDRIFITPRAKMRASEMNIDYTEINGSGPDGLIIERDVLSFEKHKVKTTPVAEKMIKENNLKAEDIKGSGIRGRITKQDVEGIISGVGRTSDRKGEIVPFRGMRKVISDRMMESIHGTAQANHRMRVDVSELIRLRNQLKESGLKVSYNDILVKIVSKALIEFPYMNSSLTEEGILLKDYVNMGLAVSVPNGLIVPNIKDADLMSLAEIAAHSSDLIQKALDGNLSQEEYSNGTFTISNLGMYDIDEFTAILNPPESGILAVGKIEKTPVAEGDNIVLKPMMTLSLTYDHRIIDGALAAQFLQRIKQLIMCPYLLL